MDGQPGAESEEHHPFANGTATAWQNETIVAALLSSMLGKQFEEDIAVRQGELHRSALMSTRSQSSRT